MATEQEIIGKTNSLPRASEEKVERLNSEYTDNRIWTLFICKTHSMFVEGDQRKSRCHNCIEAILVMRAKEEEERNDAERKS